MAGRSVGRASQNAGMIQGAGKALQKAVKEKGGLEQLQLELGKKTPIDSKQIKMNILVTLATKIAINHKNQYDSKEMKALFKELCESKEYADILKDPEFAAANKISIIQKDGSSEFLGTIQSVAGLQDAASAARLQPPEAPPRPSITENPYMVPGEFVASGEPFNPNKNRPLPAPPRPDKPAHLRPPEEPTHGTITGFDADGTAQIVIE